MKSLLLPFACLAFAATISPVVAASESPGAITITGGTGESGRRITATVTLSRPLYVGVELIPVDAPTRALFKLPETGGLLVIGVAPGSPADGKIGQGDILLNVEGQLLLDREQLRTLLRAKKAGDEVAFEILRGGRKEPVAVKLATATGSLTTGFTPLNIPGFREGRAEALKLQLNDRARRMLEKSGMDDPSLNKALSGATVILGEDGVREGEASRGAITLSLGGAGYEFTKVTSRSVIKPEGVVTVVERDGKKSVVVKDKSGKTLVEGDLDDALRAKLPEWAKSVVDGEHAPVTPPASVKPKAPAA